MATEWKEVSRGRSPELILALCLFSLDLFTSVSGSETFSTLWIPSCINLPHITHCWFLKLHFSLLRRSEKYSLNNLKLCDIFFPSFKSSSSIDLILALGMTKVEHMLKDARCFVLNWDNPQLTRTDGHHICFLLFVFLFQFLVCLLFGCALLEKIKTHVTYLKLW